jgi:aromatic-L-amino-acid/L-tryptophan decarboxylase
MQPDEFRRHGHELVDWIADYFTRVGELPVTPALRPGDIRRRLPESPPAQGESFEVLFRDFREIILPGMTHWNHPGWFAYFPGNNSPRRCLARCLRPRWARSACPG